MGDHWFDRLSDEGRRSVLSSLDKAIAWRGWDQSTRQPRPAHLSHAVAHIQEIVDTVKKDIGLEFEEYT